jgi:hypothetical protein
LVQHGQLPTGSEFDHFRDVLDGRRREALAWVGGPHVASCFDADDVEAYARWGTAADIVWGVLQAEGLFTRSRRRKSLMDYWERADKRASHYRELLRGRKHDKNVTPDFGSMTVAQYAQWEDGQKARAAAGAERVVPTLAEIKRVHRTPEGE